MGNDQPALHALFACKLGLSEPEIGLGACVCSFDLAKEAQQMGEWQNLHGVRFAKTTRSTATALILSVTFI